MGPPIASPVVEAEEINPSAGPEYAWIGHLPFRIENHHRGKYED